MKPLDYHPRPLHKVPDGETVPPSGSKVGPQCSVRPISTRKALLVVYIGHFTRYLYLLILTPFYARVLGVAEYGKVLAAMSLFNVVWMVVQYGFPFIGMRDVASTTDKVIIAAHFGAQIKARFLTAAIGIAVGAIATACSPLLKSEPAYGVIATAMGVVSAFNLGWYFQATHRFRTSTLLEVAVFAISLVLILSLVHDAGDGLTALLSLLVTSVIVTLIAYVIVVPRIGTQTARFRRGLLIRESSPLFLVNGMPTLMTSASTYLLTLFVSADQVGFFGAAERLAALVLSLMAPAGQVLVATVAVRLSSREGETQAYTLMRKSFVFTEYFGVAACLGAFMLSPYLIPLLFGRGFDSSIRIMQILGFMFPFAAFSHVVRSYVLFPLRQDKLLAMSTIAGTIFSILAILLLAAEFGALGAAVARVLGEIVTATILLVILVRQQLFARILAS